MIRLGLLAMLGTAVMPVQAQTAEEATAENQEDLVLEEVVVTGFRRSLGVALDVKRESVGVVDAIMAEDIADFPDTNLAEAMQRIPGVAINRSNGEGNTITVRGLGGQYTRVLVNGMESRAAVDGDTSRGFDFNMFASELFNSIIVQKTAAAELTDGSLGSIVNLNTARAFDYAEGTTMLLGGQLHYNDLAEEWGPRATALYSWHDPDGVFGFTASLAYQEMDSLLVQSDTVRWQRARFNSVLGDYCPTPTEIAGGMMQPAACLEVQENFHARIPRYASNELNRERLGLTAGLQWAPSNQTMLTLDAMYANYDNEQSFIPIEVLFRSNESGMDVTGYSMQEFPDRYGDPNSTVISMDVDNAWVRSETYWRPAQNSFDQLNLTFSHDFSDSWGFDAMLGTANTKTHFPHATTLMYDDRDYNGYHYDFTNMQYPVLAFNGPDVTDGTNFQLTEVRDQVHTTKNGFDAALLDVHWNINDSFTLKGGFSYKKFDFKTQQDRRDGGVCAMGLYDCAEGEIGAPGTADLTNVWTHPGRVGAGSTRTWASPDLKGWVDYFDYYNVPLREDLGRHRAVDEKNTGYWIQIDGQHVIGNGMEFLWNAGVRYVETEQSSSGYNSGVWVTVDRPKYDDTLPAINAALWVTEELVLRAAWADTMSRPNLSQLSPGGSVDSFNFAINFNNPNLDPTRSENLDFSAEWYFADEAVLALAWFQKDIESFPLRTLRRGTFASTGLPMSVIAPTSPASQTPEGTCGEPEGCWDISELGNGPGAKLDGWELAFTAPFSVFGIDDVPVLKDMGIVANYTSVDSNVEYNYNGNLINAPLLNTSESSYNLTLYYDTDTFSARIAWAYRDAYNQSGPDRSDNLWQFVDDSTYVDFSANYIFNEHWNMTFEILNLTNEKFDLMVDVDARRRLQYNDTGRNYLLGVRYRF